MKKKNFILNKNKFQYHISLTVDFAKSIKIYFDCFLPEVEKYEKKQESF